MLVIKGHFDGSVIVPDEPLDLPAGQRLVVRIEPTHGFPSADAPRQRGVTGHSLLRFAGSISADEVDAMRAAIDEGCERMNGHGW